MPRMHEWWTNLRKKIRHECTNDGRIEERRFATNARMMDELKKEDSPRMPLDLQLK